MAARRVNRTLLSILAVSVALRVGAALFLGDTVVSLPGTFDQISYHTLAIRLLEGHGFSFGQPWWPLTGAGEPTAHWSFLYTFYLAAVYGLFGVHPLVARLIQAVVVGLLQPYLVYRLAERVLPVLPQPLAAYRAAIQGTAAAITAIYIYFVYYSAALMTEPFYISAILGGLYLALVLLDRLSRAEESPGSWRLAGIFGLVLAATVLLRQLYMLFLPLLFVWLLLMAYRSRRLWVMFQRLVLAGTIVVLAILPFTVYNYQRFDSLVLLNTNSGYAFYYGNHPIYGAQFIDILPAEMGNYADLIPPALRHLDEAALDKALLAEGMRFVTDEPLRFLRLSLSRIPSYFKFWPSPDSSTISNISRVGSFGLFLPFMLYGLLLALRRPSRGLWLLTLFMVFYTGIHLLVWTLIRYRLPVDALLVIFAAYGLVDLALRLDRRFGLGWLPTADLVPTSAESRQADSR